MTDIDVITQQLHFVLVNQFTSFIFVRKEIQRNSEINDENPKKRTNNNNINEYNKKAFGDSRWGQWVQFKIYSLFFLKQIINVV